MTTTAVSTTTSARPTWRTLLQRYGLILIWIVMAIVFFVVNDVPLDNYLRGIFARQTPLVFLGMALVSTLSVGEFDLSFPSVYGLSAATVPSLVVLHGWSFPLAAVAAIVLSIAVGLVNAFLAVRVGINSVIVTLGVGSVAYGFAGWISHETSVSGMDFSLSKIALYEVLGLPALFWYGVVLVLAFGYMMSFTPLGRHIVFVGANREVARLAGIPVTMVRFGAYLTAAGLCGLAGVISSAGLGGFNASSARDYFLPAFASVFLGTAVVMPGRFNPVGMFIAVYFLINGVFGLQLLGYQGWVTDVFYGAVLVAAVAASTIPQRRANN